MSRRSHNDTRYLDADRTQVRRRPVAASPEPYAAPVRERVVVRERVEKVKVKRVRAPRHGCLSFFLWIFALGIAVLLVNFAKISPDLAVTHVNDAQDGLLEAVVLKADRRLQLAPALFAAFLDRRGQHPSRTDAMEIYAGHEIEIEANPALPIQFDGELAHATTPMRARSLPNALTAIIDEEEILRLQTLRELDEQ